MSNDGQPSSSEGLQPVVPDDDSRYQSVSQPGDGGLREALEAAEKVLLAEYHSGRLNGNRVIKAEFEKLRAALARAGSQR